MADLFTITNLAKQKVLELLQNRNKPSVGVKIGIKTRGCSGLQYNLEYADEVGQFDEVIDTQTDAGEKIKLIIDPKAIMYIMRTTMDYEENKLEAGFKFINPNEKGKCGCGESFHV